MERPSLSHFPWWDEDWLGWDALTMSKHILLVGSKPDPGWVGKLRESLKPWGGLEVAAETEALNCIRRQSFDLVILDAPVIDDVISLV